LLSFKIKYDFIGTGIWNTGKHVEQTEFQDKKMPLIPKEQNSHVYLNIPKNSISTEFDSGKK
jgi:hypothetical protein